MKRRIPAIVVLVILGLVLASFAEATQRHMWWKSDKVGTELGLTEDQTMALQDIFQMAQPDLQRLMQDLRQKGEALSGLITAAEADEWEVMLQIDQVEAARSALGKARTLMLYRMHRELSATQRDALRERFSDPSHRGQRFPPPHR